MNKLSCIYTLRSYCKLEFLLPVLSHFITAIWELEIVAFVPSLPLSFAHLFLFPFPISPFYIYCSSHIQLYASLFPSVSLILLLTEVGIHCNFGFGLPIQPSEWLLISYNIASTDVSDIIVLKKHGRHTYACTHTHIRAFLTPLFGVCVFNSHLMAWFKIRCNDKIWYIKLKVWGFFFKKILGWIQQAFCSCPSSHSYYIYSLTELLSLKVPWSTS